jgi:ABC-2 type transport system permease protein
LRRYSELYWLFLKNRFKILLEYRANFLIGAASTVMMQTAGLLTIWVVMAQVPSLKGWTLPELWLIYGLITLALSINHMFADNLWTLGEQYVRTGSFDRFLVRPVNPLFHLLADRFCHDGIGNFLVGLVLVLTAAYSLDLQWMR